MRKWIGKVLKKALILTKVITVNEEKCCRCNGFGVLWAPRMNFRPRHLVDRSYTNDCGYCKGKGKITWMIHTNKFKFIDKMIPKVEKYLIKWGFIEYWPIIK